MGMNPGKSPGFFVDYDRANTGWVNQKNDIVVMIMITGVILTIL